MNNARTKLEAQLDRLLDDDRALVNCREKYLFDLLSFPFNDSLVLFGAGGLGRRTLSGLRKLGIEPVAFADNNASLWGSRVEGVSVLSPAEAAHRYGQNSTFVITIWRAGGNHRFAHTRSLLFDLKCLRVVSFAHLYWKYAEQFLPYYAIDLPHALYPQADQIRSAFALWHDDASRAEYLAQLRLRLCLDFDALPHPVAHKQYFPDDLIEMSNEEIIVDCGAYDGDTIKSVLEILPSFKGEIIALEPDPLNLKNLNDYLSTLRQDLRDRVKVHVLAAGSRRETVYFEAAGTAASGVNPKGSLQVSSVPLDEIRGDKKTTFIKMDIEGAELDALSGARGVINQNVPILAICVYHKPDHLWRIPLFLQSLTDQYRYFLRPHNEEGWDLICYAIPIDRLKDARRGAGNHA